MKNIMRLQKQNKMLLISILFFVIMILVLPEKVLATEEQEEGNLRYTIQDEKAIITGSTIGTSELTEIVIPDTIEGYPITGIMEWAFYGYEKVTTISLPDGLETIGDYAFYNCIELKTMTLPEELESIGESAFKDCKELKTITLPKSLSKCYGAFRKSGIEEVILQEGCKEIPNGIFAECENLTKINLPEGLEKIEESAFGGCTSLAEIEFPNGLESIGNCAFSRCTSLTTIELPEGLESIGYNAFDGCTSLRSVKMSNYITDIGSGIFENCTSLTEVILPEDLKTVGNFFIGCTALTEINIPESVETIGYDAFKNCSKLTKVNLPQELNYISSSAFQGCTSLITIELPESLECIDSNVFQECTSLIEIKIPENISYISGGIFRDCTSLKSIILPKRICEVGDSAFENCISLTNINLSDDITSIGNNAFKKCKSLVNIRLPKSLTSISNYAFRECTSLESVKMFVDVKEINDSAFYGCTKLSTIYGITGSYSETFANKNGYEFIGIEKDVNNCEIKGIENKEYTGEELTQEITIKDDEGSILEEEKDYTIEYENNKNSGTATIKITGKGNYRGIANKTFKIIAKDIKEFTIYNVNDKTYNGKEITQDNISVYGNSYYYQYLEKGKDYKISYKDNINAGTAIVIITGIGNYSGTIEKKFNIQSMYIYQCDIPNIKDQKYTGKAIKPKVVVKHGSTVLQQGKDYDVKYEYNIDAGWAQVIITGKGNYTGTTYRGFQIVGKDFTKIKAIIDTSNKNYTGKAITTSIVLKDGKTTLKKGKDYEVEYIDNKNPGTASVVIWGKGKYYGDIYKRFKIVVKQVKKLATKSQDTSNIVVKWDKDSTFTGYEVYMSTSKNGKYTKYATISKNSTTTYKKSKLTDGKTYYFKVRGYVTIGKAKKYGAYSSVLTTTTETKAPKISEVTTKSKKATVKWKKVSGATGYEVYMSNSKNGKYTKVGTNTKNSKVSYTSKKLTKGKTYYFKVRTYRVVDGNKVYSSYSNIKFIKIK